MSTPDFAAEWVNAPTMGHMLSRGPAIGAESGPALLERMYDLGRSSGEAAEAYRAALKAAGEVARVMRRQAPSIVASEHCEAIAQAILALPIPAEFGADVEKILGGGK